MKLSEIIAVTTAPYYLDKTLYVCKILGIAYRKTGMLHWRVKKMFDLGKQPFVIRNNAMILARARGYPYIPGLKHGAWVTDHELTILQTHYGVRRSELK